MTSRVPASSRAPQYVWLNEQGEGRNIFALFRHDFSLPNLPKTLQIHLFADTRYRLQVNGSVASYGPARFYPTHPEFDTVELAPFLRKGNNTVTVEVQSRGTGTFESIASTGGFIAWGGGKVGTSQVDFSTPGKWQVWHLQGYESWAPTFSFAQGPTEVVDTTRHSTDLFCPDESPKGGSKPVPRTGKLPWGKLAPRSIPALTLGEILPEKVLTLAPLAGDEKRIGTMMSCDCPPRGGQETHRACYVSFIHSPSEQTVTLGMFWGPHYLNGVELPFQDSKEKGNRRDYTAKLKKGWNVLYGEPEMLAPSWPVLVAYPSQAGLELRAEPSLESKDSMLYTAKPVGSQELEAVRKKIPADADEIPTYSVPWTRVPLDALIPTPTYEVSWDKAVAAEVKEPHTVTDLNVPLSKMGEGVAVFDFGKEYLGHYMIEIDAPAGAVLDLSGDERLRQDGTVAIFESHFLVNSTDRYLLRKGRQVIEGFHPRGGRYLQVTVRHAKGPVKLHRAALRETLYPSHVEASFQSGEPIFQYIWETGIRTVQVTSEDSFTDCPWRERGLYLGDTLVEFHVTKSFLRDTALTRRCIRVFQQSQGENGAMAPAAPSEGMQGQGDFSLIWIMVLHDFWAHTSDLKLVQEMWPSVSKIVESSSWEVGEHGLWKNPGFVDWGVPKESKQSGENGHINAFRYRALTHAAILAKALKKPKEAAHFQKEADKVFKLYQILWDAKAGHFKTGIGHPELEKGSALHANILALSFGLCTPEQQPLVLAHVLKEMQGNHHSPACRAELFFLYYLLGTLYELGHAAEAEQIILNHYGILKAQGAWTIWECLGSGRKGRGSLCHGWATAPIQIFTERILGVRQAKSALPDEVIIQPESGLLKWAAGKVPHRHGLIEVSWRIKGNQFILETSAPKKVKVTARLGASFAHLALVWSHKKL